MSVTQSVSASAARKLGQSLRGELIDPTHPRYEQARSLCNATIDKRPALIARCVDVADVITCVSWAAAEGVELTWRVGYWEALHTYVLGTA
jgi:hypothetical protein